MMCTFVYLSTKPKTMLCMKLLTSKFVGYLHKMYRKYANKSRPQIRAATRIRAAFYLVNTDQNYVKT